MSSGSRGGGVACLPVKANGMMPSVVTKLMENVCAPLDRSDIVLSKKDLEPLERAHWTLAPHPSGAIFCSHIDATPNMQLVAITNQLLKKTRRRFPALCKASNIDVKRCVLRIAVQPLNPDQQVFIALPPMPTYDRQHKLQTPPACKRPRTENGSDSTSAALMIDDASNAVLVQCNAQGEVLLPKGVIDQFRSLFSKRGVYVLELGATDSVLGAFSEERAVQQMGRQMSGMSTSMSRKRQIAVIEDPNSLALQPVAKRANSQSEGHLLLDIHTLMDGKEAKDMRRKGSTSGKVGEKKPERFRAYDPTEDPEKLFERTFETMARTKKKPHAELREKFEAMYERMHDPITIYSKIDEVDDSGIPTGEPRLDDNGIPVGAKEKRCPLPEELQHSLTLAREADGTERTIKRVPIEELKAWIKEAARCIREHQTNNLRLMGIPTMWKYDMREPRASLMFKNGCKPEDSAEAKMAMIEHNIDYIKRCARFFLSAQMPRWRVEFFSRRTARTVSGQAGANLDEVCDRLTDKMDKDEEGNEVVPNNIPIDRIC